LFLFIFILFVFSTVFCPFQRTSNGPTEVWVGMSDGKLLRVDVTKNVLIEVAGVHTAAIWFLFFLLLFLKFFFPSHDMTQSLVP